MTPHLDRRRALAGTAAAGIALPVLAACGADFADDSGVALDPGASETPCPSASQSPGVGEALTTTDQVPVGSGQIFPEQQVVVTQPTEGEFRCFTAVCTHQGCIVSSVSYGGIRCECHGSGFSIEDGSAVNPPATQPLAERQIKVKGDTITLF
jgi:nitrite reductase/ring-hydroxylating ferredoxin subunit